MSGLGLTRYNVALKEALANCTALRSGPDGHGGMRVIAYFDNGGDEQALFDLLNIHLEFARRDRQS